jgi:oligopeptide/dipeptide ABC transporter ATP-binding protein
MRNAADRPNRLNRLEEDVQRGQELLRLRDVKTYYVAKPSIFPRRVEYVRAVDGVSFHILKGETFGLVGESGCGKSTVGQTILRLEEACAGEILYRGCDLRKLPARRMRALRSRLQIVFQDPFSSLNPRMSVGALIMEPMLVHRMYTPKERAKRVEALLEMVGLSAYHAKRYPHEFSGGQRQRIDIARALAVNPELIICDEAVSALDVSIQAQVLNLLARLQREMNLTYLFIAHGLAAVRHISNRIGVMYLGKIVEIADSDALLSAPAHPYTQALISAIPVPDPDVQVRRVILQGEVPSPIHPPSGCRFHTRCKYATERCAREEPALREIEPNHRVACHLADG